MSNRFVKSILFVLISLFVISQLVYALEVETHEAINETVAKGTMKGFSLDSYLKTNLGINEGVTAYLKDKDNKANRIYEWIKLGGRYEDKPPRIIPYTRSMNHFHDPLINWEYAGFKGNFKSAVLWAQEQDTFGSLWGGDWSWKKARNSFYKGLTDIAKTNRENDFTDTFRALGQIMHLVEDVSVPAHTRSDTHVIGYHYELAVDKFRRNDDPIFTDALTRPITFDPAILSLLPNPLASIPVAKIFDIDKYNMPNPDPNVTVGSTIGLSEYTNANFVSEGLLSANFQDFPFPKMSDTSIAEKSYTGQYGTYMRQYYKKSCCGETNDGKGYLLAAVDYLDYWRKKFPILSAGLPKIPVLDDNVYKDYASLLIPRAVGYSAGLLNYFFRGEMDMVSDDATGSGYVIVNNTDEDMNGTFELYYDNSSDERIGINGWSLSIGKKSSGNNKSTNIAFTKPDNMKEDGKYMLVFRGKLGSEEDAVAGRRVDLKGGEYVFLVSAYDHSVAAFKIKTTNNQYQLIPVSKDITITFSDAPSTLLTVQSHPDKKEHVVALPWYSYDYSGNLITNYEPNIANYGKKIPYSDYLGYTHYVTVGFPQAYIPKNFEDDESPYIWDAGFTYGEWTYTKVGNDSTPRFASYIHGRRPFSMVDDKLVEKNINIRKNDAYTYSGDDYAGPFHIQYKNKGGEWIKGIDLQSNENPIAVIGMNKRLSTYYDGNNTELKLGDVLLDTIPRYTHYENPAPPSDWIYDEEGCEYLSEWGEGGGETGSPPGEVIYTGSGSWGYESYSLFVNDYDNMNEDNTFIAFFSEVSNERNVTYDVSIHNDAGFCYSDNSNGYDNYYGTTKFYLACRYNGSNVIKIELATLTSTLENYLNPTLHPTLSGTRISGQSSQINDRNIVYTYIVERPERVADKDTWIFVKRIVGMINISDNSFPTGYRQEFELDFSETGFDPEFLAAIGVHAD